MGNLRCMGGKGKMKDNYQISLRYTVKMDRPIIVRKGSEFVVKEEITLPDGSKAYRGREVNWENPEGHYLSPGTKELKLADGTVLPFDFMDSEISVNGDEAYVCEKHLDTETFPLTVILGECLCNHNVSGFNFFIYTGEDNEPEIHPVEVKDVVFSVYDPDTLEDDDIDFSIGYRLTVEG